MVFGIRNGRVKERLLREADLTLERALAICRAAETSLAQLQTISGQSRGKAADISIISKLRHKGRPAQTVQKKGKEYDCAYCGKLHAYGKCPAYGKTCSRCGSQNHFAVVCGSGNRNGLSQRGKDGKPETQVRETKVGPHGGDQKQSHFGKARPTEGTKCMRLMNASIVPLSMPIVMASSLLER